MTLDRRLLRAEEAAELLGFGMSGPARGDDAPRERELFAIDVRAAVHRTGIAQAFHKGELGHETAFL